MYSKVSFTLRYLLGNVSDFDPATQAVPYAQLAAADRYILGRFAALVDECTTAYGNFQVYKGAQPAPWYSGLHGSAVWFAALFCKVALRCGEPPRAG